MEDQHITLDMMIHAYARGIFPMSEGIDDPEIFWCDPPKRGVIEVDQFHISKSLAKTLRTHPYEISVNRDFEGVIDACADRDETWINPVIRDLFIALHHAGFAHSIEVWEDKSTLVGGLYGGALGAIFFGESMFSSRTDTSKIAMAHLIKIMKKQGMELVDTQFITDHLASLGAIEIDRAEYHARLRTLIQKPVSFV